MTSDGTDTVRVVKVGGRELHPSAGLEVVAGWVARQSRAGRCVILVHGGGEEVTDRAAALGLRSVHEHGQRVTSAPMLEIVTEVLAGRINTRLVRAVTRAGAAAAGLTGATDRLLTVTPAGDPAGSLGWVGKPRAVHARVLRILLDAGLVPVLAPLGVDRKGNLYNVNADLAAAAIAATLEAELFLVTDVPGVSGEAETVLPELSVPEARRLREAGVITGGMIPKIEAAEHALRSGATRVWIGPLGGLGGEGPLPGTGTWIHGGIVALESVAVPTIRASMGRRGVG